MVVEEAAASILLLVAAATAVAGVAVAGGVAAQDPVGGGGGARVVGARGPVTDEGAHGLAKKRFYGNGEGSGGGDQVDQPKSVFIVFFK